MKKMLFMAATAALALASCTSEDALNQAVQKPAEDGAISFGVYHARQTRALTPAQEQNITDVELQSEGFGVFAYEQGNKNLLSYLTTSTVPNFMYNDHVTYAASKWTSEVVKYWPNNEDYVSFQAYAPYSATVQPLFNIAYNGIGIRYSIDDNYDLLWGQAAGETTCFVDQQKPNTTKTLDFVFKHALTKVDINVSYNADEDCDALAKALDVNTKITIKSVKLVGNIPTQGVLSLYDGKWFVEKSNGDWQFTTDDFNSTAAVGDAGATTAGVLDKDTKKLYANNSLMVIPAGDVYLEITYDVESGTKGDDNYSCVTNTIQSNAIPTTGYPDTHGDFTDGKISLEAGKWTTINIHLGMTSVKFTATVSAWDDTDNGDIDLPANVCYSVVPASAVTSATSQDNSTYDATAHDGEYIIDSNDNKLYLSDGSTWNAISTTPMPVVKVGSDYKHTATAGGAYTTVTAVADLDALNSQPDGYYTVGGVLYEVKH